MTIAGVADTLLVGAITIGGAVVLLWLLSLPLEDTSIVDIFWGFGFVLTAWVVYAWASFADVPDGGEGRRLLLTVLVTVWGLRLTLYLAWRNLGKGEDFRYQAMRRRWGRRWWWVSLIVVFLFQGALMWVVSLPVQVGVLPSSPGIGPLAFVGATVWAVGVFFETVGDVQLARFKSHPENRGLVMDRGLWRYTRHPNYFGDFCVWWGIWLVALDGSGTWWTVVGPVTMSILLLRVSGVTLLERALAKRRHGYEDYAARTSAFFPRRPKRIE